MLSFSVFKKNLETLQSEISTVCQRIGRNPSEIQILPVTKNQPAEILQHITQTNLHSIAENKIQEASSKKQSFLHPHSSPITNTSSLRWELIGHLQSNKAKLALELFDRIQSVDSEKLLLTLNQHTQQLNKSPYPILLQVNTAQDPAKFGLSEENIYSAVETLLQHCPHLKLQGLMTIAPLTEDIAHIRKSFRKLKLLRNQLQSHFNITLPELSMGMSNDWQIALEEGSTILRIGTLLFGQR